MNLNLHTKFLRSLTVLLFASTVFSVNLMAQNEETPQIRTSFWQEVDFEFDIGISSFAGDFSNQGDFSDWLPIPVNGFSFGIHLNENVYFNRRLSGSIRVGLSAMSYASVTQFDRNIVDPNLASGRLVPANIRNTVFGPEIGAGLRMYPTPNFSIEPMLSFGIYYNDPRADAFFNQSGDLVEPDIPTNRATRDFSIRDVPEAVADGETIPGSLMAITYGMRFNFMISDTEFFTKVSYRDFLSPYFDGVRDISLDQGPNRAAIISVGMNLPVQSGPRTRDLRAGLGWDLRTQLDFAKGSMDMDSPEDREVFFELFDDIAVDRDTPGLMIDELANQIQFFEHNLGNTNYSIVLNKLPGNTFMIGHVDEDPFRIQNYGRLRVSVQDFAMSPKAITNKQYKLFMAAMGLNFPGSENYQQYIIGNPPSMQELLERAQIDLSEVPVDIQLTSVENLRPDPASWNELNINNVLPFSDYFYSEAYNDHPVVAVNWYQAMLFAAWSGLRLPNEVEWEYAAKSGVGGRVFPWDGYTGQDSSGNYLANYMQERGVYNLDGYTLFAPVDAFEPNRFRLYNMAGNVSEWVLDSYSSTYRILEQDRMMVTPSNFNLAETRKVHRGGSWASSLFFIGSGVRNHHQGHRASPLIGFRVATSSAAVLENRVLLNGEDDPNDGEDDDSEIDLMDN